MAYDEILAERIRTLLARRKGFSERNMFGGVCFMFGGNMACGVVKEELMVRVGPERYEEALGLPHARPMDFTKRPMRGMVFVEPEGVRADGDLKAWVERGLKFARSLPAK